jgi:hypothetical protein
LADRRFRRILRGQNAPQSGKTSKIRANPAQIVQKPKKTVEIRSFYVDFAHPKGAW